MAHEIEKTKDHSRDLTLRSSVLTIEAVTAVVNDFIGEFWARWERAKDFQRTTDLIDDFGPMWGVLEDYIRHTQNTALDGSQILSGWDGLPLMTTYLGRPVTFHARRRALPQRSGPRTFICRKSRRGGEQVEATG